MEHLCQKSHYNGPNQRELLQPQDICEAFNDDFISISRDMYCENLYNTDYLNGITYNVTSPYRLQNVSEADIVRHIASLRSDAATGCDGISSKFLKIYQNKLARPLAYTINKAIQSGIYPDSLKTSTIVPILKHGSSMDVRNYRPISVLCSLNMVIEGIIKEWLVALLDRNDIIHPNQYGFVKKSNTETAVVHLTHSVAKSIQDGQLTAVIFLDLKKAFDSVDHRILEHKISKLNLAANERSLIVSYLDKRHQMVKVNGRTSSKKEAIAISVPQGSRIGPVIFNFVINDIHELEIYGEIQQFADDTSVKYKASSLTELNHQMSHDLEILNDWLKSNHLQINAEKTKYMIFSKSNVSAQRINTHNFQLNLNGQAIERVRDITYLGVQIDDLLHWDRHIEKVRCAIAPYVFALRKIRPYTTEHTSTLIYNAYIASRLVYVSSAWNNATSTSLERLRVLQHKALKSILKLPHLTPSHTLFSPKFLSIDNLMTQRLLIFIHRIKNEEVKHSFYLQTVAEIHEYNTRNRNNFFVGTRGGRTEEANILRKGLMEYNRLPDIMKTLPTSKFKKQLRLHLSD